VFVAEFQVCGVGGFLFFEGSFARVLHREGGGNDQHFFFHAFGLAGEDHSGDAGIDGEAGEFCARG